MRLIESLHRAVQSRRYRPQLAPHATSQPLLYQPGTNWNYAHTNYVLLGLALEKASGQEMSKLLSEKVLQPLGLTNTNNNLTPEIPSPVPTSWRRKSENGWIVLLPRASVTSNESLPASISRVPGATVSKLST